MTALLVIIGAGIGAPARWLVDRKVQGWVDGAFPWGTFTVNMAGSFALGLVLAATTLGGADPHWATLLGTGFCGAFTTFSTFAFETSQLWEVRSRAIAAANVGASVLLGTALAFAGWYAVAWVS